MWKGEFLKEFLAEGIHARGLDQSDYAKKINPPHTVDVHDILKTKKLPYDDNTFEFVFSKSVVEHFLNVILYLVKLTGYLNLMEKL